MTAGGGARREPLLLGLIGGLIGIGLAIVVFGGFLGGPASPVGASASPTSAAIASDGPSSGPTLSAAPTMTAVPTAEVTLPPVTAAPTATPAPPPTAQPTPTPNTNPRIVSFETPNQEDCTNATAGSVHVEWSIRNATGVTISIDGPGIYNSYAGLTGSVDLPYGCDSTVLKHTYTLRTVGGTGPVASVTNTIRTRAPSITSFTVSKPDCSGGETFVGINVSFEIRAATGAELSRDGMPYSTYNTKATDDIVMYDCSQNDQEWVLTTTGGYGPEASKSIKVSKN
jgi:hypothetical protein